jgi:hypothetical protein
MWGGFALFVTYFVHNVSASVSYGKKLLLDNWTADHSPRMRQRLLLQQAGRTGHSPNTRQGQHRSYLQEEETQVQRTQSAMPH